VSIVALTWLVVSVISSPPAAGAVAGTAAAVALGVAGVLVADGTAAVPGLGTAAGGAEAVAAGRGAEPPNSGGAPVCLFHASHNRTSDITNTSHNKVRRISVMGVSWRKGG
jgi:hypothetical protein